MITTRSLRLACDLGRLDGALDPRTNLSPVAIRNVGLLLQVAAFRDGVIVDDVTNIETVKARVFVVDAQGNLGAEQFTAVAVGAAIGACTEPNWENGTDEHAYLTISAADLDLAAGDYKLIIFAITAAGAAIPWAHCKLTVIDLGIAADESETPETSAATPAWRISPSGEFLQLKDSGTGLWSSVWLENGAIQIGPGV
jgi:hypothetical protein